MTEQIKGISGLVDIYLSIEKPYFIIMEFSQDSGKYHLQNLIQVLARKEGILKDFDINKRKDIYLDIHKDYIRFERNDAFTICKTKDFKKALKKLAKEVD